MPLYIWHRYIVNCVQEVGYLFEVCSNFGSVSKPFWLVLMCTHISKMTFSMTSHHMTSHSTDWQRSYFILFSSSWRFVGGPTTDVRRVNVDVIQTLTSKTHQESADIVSRAKFITLLHFLDKYIQYKWNLFLPGHDILNKNKQNRGNASTAV